MNPHALGSYTTLHLAQVLENSDPDGRGRIRVRLLATGMEVWASTVVPSAGRNYGVTCLPRIDEIVAVAFVSPDYACVLGSIWTGSGAVPADADPHEDHYVVRTPSGTVMEFDDGSGPKLEIRSPQGYRITITDGSGGEIVIERGGQSVKLTASEVNITSSATVSINASNVRVSAAMMTVDAGMSRFSGVVQADTVITNSVVSASYTPGAGNIW